MTTPRAFLGLAAAALALGAAPRVTMAQTVQQCPNSSACAQLKVDGGNGAVGSTVPVALTFTQASDDHKAGGPDETAALAFTLSIASGGIGTPLVLADCTLNADGLPAAVHPDPTISNFKVVVENASCTDSRPHCLCNPGATQTLDNFINIVVYGPNPLPTPGPNPITIPLLPSGPPPFVTIDLKVARASGNVQLHLYNQVQDAAHPQFTAFLSTGDEMAVDQTCVPVQGQPPCGAAQAVSQVVTVDDVLVTPAVSSCVGDCDSSGMVTVDEVVTMANIQLGILPLSACTAGDGDKSGTITVDEVVKAINNLLGGCGGQ